MKKDRNLVFSRATGAVRIIAGRWKGRKLPVLSAEGLRPTTDRVRETLFNWLMADIADARCLDCFAGSGALGLEALSRQAQAVVFVEKSAPVATQLKNNLTHLHCNNANVIHGDIFHFLAHQNNGETFDVVFIDPPFYHNFIPNTFELLAKNNWLSSSAFIYLETEKNYLLPPLPNHWQIIKEKKAGQVMSRLIRVKNINTASEIEAEM